MCSRLAATSMYPQGVGVGDARRLVTDACAIEQGFRDATLGTPLSGYHLALLNPDPDAEAALCFRDAAHGLGAGVATLASPLAFDCPSSDAHRVARTLGCLYDAIACQDMSLELVQSIRAGAGKSVVFDRLATAHHPIAGLENLLGEGVPAAHRRMRLVQAMLIRSLTTHANAGASKVGPHVDGGALNQVS